MMRKTFAVLSLLLLTCAFALCGCGRRAAVAGDPVTEAETQIQATQYEDTAETYSHESIDNSALEVEADDGKNDGDVQENHEEAVPNGTYSAKHVYVDVATNTNGFYALMTEEATVEFDENGELLSVYAEDAYVVAFKVSDIWEGGIYIYSGEEMQSILDSLKAIAGDNKDLLSVIKQLENGGPIEGAST